MADRSDVFAPVLAAHRGMVGHASFLFLRSGGGSEVDDAQRKTIHGGSDKQGVLPPVNVGAAMR